ncbi:MAG: hydrolase [Gelidibacter sp.]
MNSKSVLESYEKQLTHLEKKEKAYKDSIATLQDQMTDLKLFDLKYNDDALDYFENQGYNALELIPFIKDELYKLNNYEGDDHPIVPYASMTGNKMMINNIRLLNHKWIIANYSDGKYWGEMLIKYTVSDKKELKFEVLDYLMYRP